MLIQTNSEAKNSILKRYGRQLGICRMVVPDMGIGYNNRGCIRGYLWASYLKEKNQNVITPYEVKWVCLSMYMCYKRIHC